MESYKDALKYLESFINFENIGFSGLKLDPEFFNMREALGTLGLSQSGYKSMHVAGTKGKGSICEFAASILEKSGYKVGVFTSPHLDTVRERIKINGKYIKENEFSEILDYFKGKLGDAIGEKFTYFEILTLMAREYFAREKIDYAVFETGLGGRLDATNVVRSEVCVFSPISYDHMNVLGENIEAIASEKAAIIKDGVRCVSSAQTEKVCRIIEKKCAEEGASLLLAGRDITYDIKELRESGSSFDIKTPENHYENCWTRLPGEFQVSNCAVATVSCEQLLDGAGIDIVKFKSGMENAFLPARLEVVKRCPLIVIDGAQNGDSARKLKYSIEQIFKYDRLILLLGLSKDKDIGGVCKELVPIASDIVLTRAETQRALSPEVIRGYVKGKPAQITHTAKEAVGTALKLASERDLILVAGSFFLAQEVRELITRVL